MASGRGNARIRRNHLRPPGDYSQHCRGKRRHTSRKMAVGVIRVMKMVHANDDLGNLEAYKCPNCHGWHVGNTRRR